MLLAAGLVVLALIFRALATLLLGVLITVIIAIPLSGAATWLGHHRVPRPLGAALALLAGLAVVGGIGALLVPRFVAEGQVLIDQLPAIAQSLQARLAELTGIDPGILGERFQRSVNRYAQQPLRLAAPIASIGLSLAAALISLVLVLLTAYFAAARPDPLVRGALRLFRPPQRRRVREVMERLRTSWLGWMRGVGIEMLVLGVLLYAGLSLVGLEFALYPPFLFAFTDSPEQALLVLLVYVAAQQIEGNVLVPVIMSRTVKIHPAVIAVGVVVVGELLGVIGLAVAVPIIAATQILVEELWTRPMEARSPAQAPSSAQAPSPSEPASEGASAGPAR